MVAMLKMPLRIGPQAEGADRRMFPRKEIHARIEGKRLDHTVQAHRQPQLSLMLRDLSFGGLSAICQAPLNRGDRLSVFFPPQGINRGWDAYGRVLRCEPTGVGYRIAVEFDPLPAA
jgi:PilZ domain-containing protein